MVEKEAEYSATQPEDRPPTEAVEESTEIKGKPDEGESFQELYEESLHEIAEGEVVHGRVIHVGPEFVTVDIGFKSEGQLALNEFRQKDGTVAVQVGDEVDVFVERKESEIGMVTLSKEKADKHKFWEEISRAWNEDQVIEGKIISRIKGGLTVDIGVLAFLPGSQVDIRPIRNLEKLIGHTYKFKIIKLNRRRGNVVLSRRILLEKERESIRQKTLEVLEEGQIVEGVVKNITDYGAFIDLGGIDGLLHITDMSWGRINRPSDILAPGQKIKVKVLQFERQNQRVSLGLKQTTPDPWENIAAKFPVGSRVKGKVTSITDYGAFVQLLDGVEGLVHVSEMAWTKRVRHPSKILSAGDEVEVMVLDVDPNQKRISLGLKQTSPNPWDTIAERYPVGTKIQGRIKNITDFGIFIGIDEGIDGLVHISDVSWVQRLKHPSEMFKKGQEVQAIVLSIDRENQRFSLGIKQIQKNPWDDIHHRYRVGQMVKGKVTNVTKFGAFVELEPGIEGLVHISEISHQRVEKAEDVVKAGNEIQAVVINVDPRRHKIGLSIKDVERYQTQQTRKETQAAYEDDTSDFGRMLKEGLERRAREANSSKES
ncbi:MAG: 30S ribosomal protein S1 [Syntrophaceae bacterium]|jgi:small subunit ribosomal protein S1|nr:30S ribosomal protein S1 [Syntrophaceae bacterium]